MSEMLTYPLVEKELFSSHWDDGWDILSEDKENEKQSEKGDEVGENRGQRVVPKGHHDDGPNGKQNDKEYEEEEEEEEEEDVEQIREEISKVIESVMQTGIDQDNPASHFGIRPSSSPAKSRRRRHRPFPSRELNSSSRGMSADHLASSPPSTFEIQHEHQPVRGRNHINRNDRPLESNNLAETIEYTPETETPNVSPSLRFSKTVPPGKTVRQESSEDQSSEDQSSEEESSDEESVKVGFVESGLEVVEQEESGEEDSSEEGSSDDEEESSEEESSEEDFVAADNGKQF
jgi:hypothetical protein